MLVYSGLEDFMKAIKHEKVAAALACMITLAAVSGLVVSGLNKSERKAVTAEVESFDEVDSNSKDMNNILSLEGMDNILVGASLNDFYASTEGTNKKSREVVTETVTEVATEEQTAEPETEEATTEYYEYENTFLVNVSEFLNVRAEASEEAAIVGKIYPAGGGTVLEKGAEWSKIQSGNVIGYIKNEYAWFSHDAQANIPYVCPLIATSTTDNLRLRKGPGTDYKIDQVVGAGTQYQVIAEEGEWKALNVDGQTLYAAAEFMTTQYVVGSGITVEEEQAAIEAENARLAEEAAAEAARIAEEEAAKQQQIANAGIPDTIYTSAYNVTEEDAYLLACLVMAEAGGESYDGKLAVANIVLNRLNSGKYGSTISSVIYANNQFSVVKSGVLDRIISKGPNSGCVQAAADALAGMNNVPNYTSFCTTGVANYGRYHSYSIIDNQVFYR
jgi:spore germination cell wall hydrolase CwlJ-like protein